MSILNEIPLLKKAIDIGSAMLVVIVLSALVGLILAFPVMWLWDFVLQKSGKQLVSKKS